jgi:carbonic anhydrase
VNMVQELAKRWRENINCKASASMLKIVSCCHCCRHCCCRSSHTVTGGLAVMAVLLEAPTASSSAQQQQQQPLPNPALAAGLAAVPDTPGVTAISATPINPGDLLPSEPSALQQYIAYRGSLTTPPCSEGVDWLVWTRPLLVPQQQVDAFRRFAGGANARPLQPLNSRAVVAYNNCLSTV